MNEKLLTGAGLALALLFLTLLIIVFSAEKQVGETYKVYYKNRDFARRGNSYFKQ